LDYPLFFENSEKVFFYCIEDGMKQAGGLKKL